jgi:hypothetical protein
MQRGSKAPSIAKRSPLAGAQVNTHTHPDADDLPLAAGQMVYGKPLMGGCLPPRDGISQLANDKPPPISNTRSSFSSGSSRALLSARDRTSAASSSQGRTLPSQPAAMLRNSQPAEGGQYGFIYLAAQELPDQAAIIAYFDNTGREVSVLPCLDFDGFLTSNSL